MVPRPKARSLGVHRIGPAILSRRAAKTMTIEAPPISAWRSENSSVIISRPIRPNSKRFSSSSSTSQKTKSRSLVSSDMDFHLPLLPTISRLSGSISGRGHGHGDENLDRIAIDAAQHRHSEVAYDRSKAGAAQNFSSEEQRRARQRCGIAADETENGEKNDDAGAIVE